VSRSYEQTCYIARSLDVLGERWTFLILRELALGPRRYGDLLSALPGMGTSLLASRLKHLEQHDVVHRMTLPGPGRGTSYELTDRGEALMPALACFAEWGAALGDPPPEYVDRAAWSVVAMRLTAPGEAAGFNTLTELAVGDETLWLRGDSQRVQAGTGPAPMKPGLRLTSAKETFYALAKKQVTVDDAVASGRLAVDGELEIARLFFEVFSLPKGPALERSGVS
jgi:DNA-binding HxlR family transcriptional regulator